MNHLLDYYFQDPSRCKNLEPYILLLLTPKNRMRRLNVSARFSADNVTDEEFFILFRYRKHDFGRLLSTLKFNFYIQDRRS